jgi:mannose-6-phosphate isomerase-like protein (cupin superfamily)
MKNNSLPISINVYEKFSLFHDHWSPKIIAELNGQEVKLAKIKGEFVWHNHEHEDELFFVIKGQLTIEFKDRTITVSEGGMVLVPKGVDHRPIAKEEVWLLLFETVDTKHTGSVKHQLTVERYQHL